MKRVNEKGRAMEMEMERDGWLLHLGLFETLDMINEYRNSINYQQTGWEYHIAVNLPVGGSIILNWSKN